MSRIHTPYFTYGTALFLVCAFVMPYTASAQTNDLFDVASLFLEILGFTLPVIIGLALVYFIWGVVKYIGAGDSSEARTAARGHMIFGIIALFIMVSVWGLVHVLIETFGVGTTTPPVRTEFQ